MTVSFELRGDVGLITLHRPDSFNAITAELSRDFQSALERAGTESRACVITGSGRAFCAGADLAEIKAGYDESGPNLGSVLDKTFHPSVQALISVGVPTVAAVNGVAAGAGMGLALACDLRLIAEKAFFMSAFAAIGLAPDSGTTWWLPHHLGVSRALEITMTNRRVPANEAVDLGLCMRALPTEELVDAAVGVASELADLVPDSLVTTRKLIRDASGASFTDALEAEREAQHRLGLTAEHAEGVSAFLEKRAPDYRSI